MHTKRRKKGKGRKYRNVAYEWMERVRDVSIHCAVQSMGIFYGRESTAGLTTVVEP